MPPCSHRLARLLPLSLALGLLLAGNVQAQALYQVELVVFARDSAEAEVEESWQRDYGLSYPKRLIGLASAPESVDPTQPATPFQLLPASARQLNESARAIDRRSNLRVLFHGAWIQPVGGIESADPVLITGGRTYGSHHELEGYVVVTSERYLRLRADLWMTRFGSGNALDTNAPVLPEPVITVQPAATTPTATDTAAETATTAISPTPTAGVTDFGYIPDQIYALDQERRMRSSELHYIDHPRFSVLVQVTPYKAPEPAPVPVESAPTPTADVPPISTAPVAATTAAP